MKSRTGHPHTKSWTVRAWRASRSIQIWQRCRIFFRLFFEVPDMGLCLAGRSWWITLWRRWTGSFTCAAARWRAGWCWSTRSTCLVSTRRWISGKRSSPSRRAVPGWLRLGTRGCSTLSVRTKSVPFSLLLVDFSFLSMVWCQFRSHNYLLSSFLSSFIRSFIRSFLPSSPFSFLPS